MGSRLHRHGHGPHRIQQLRTRQEHDARAGGGQHPAIGAGIDFEIVPAALHGAERNCVGHDPRLETRLDDEEASNAPQPGLCRHAEVLSKQRASGAFARFFS